MADEELDVRPLPKPDKHPAVFARYDALAPGTSFVLVNDHDPKHLRREFEIEHPEGHGWQYLDNGADGWRIRISKLATTSLPRVLHNTSDLADDHAPDVTGAVWKLQMRRRDLDSNVIHLPPAGTIGAHAGPDLDVLVHVLRGTGQLATELGAVPLRTGALVWLPRRSTRGFTAGPEGLTYLTIHQRRQALLLDIGQQT